MRRGESSLVVGTGLGVGPRSQIRLSPRAATDRVCPAPSQRHSATCSRLQSSDPVHPVTPLVQKWVDAEAFLERVRPAQTLWLAAAFLPQQGEHGVVRAGLGPWGQKPEVADVVPVTVGHVIGQRGQEVSCRIPGHDHLFRLRVFRQEFDFVTVNLPETVLCDGGTAGVAACVAEELFLAPEPLDVGIPPPLLLPLQEGRKLGRGLVGLQGAHTIRFSQVGHHGVAPQGHQCLAVERRAPPRFSVSIEPAFGDEHVQVTIEVQVATEGMWDHQDHQPRAVYPPGPLFDNLGPQDRKVVEQVAVLPEQGPEHIWHREADVGIGSVW